MRMESPLNQRLRWSPPDVVYTPIDVTSRLTPKRNSLSRLWPVQISDHSPFTLLQSPQQELPESPALLDLAEYRLHSLHPQSVALPTPAWSVTSVASGPWETDGWVCDLGARVAQPGRGGSAPARRTGPRPEHKARRLPSPSNSQHQRILPWGLHRRCRWSPPPSPQPVAYPKSGWWPAPPRSPGERCPPPPDSCTLAGSPFLQVRG